MKKESLSELINKCPELIEVIDNLIDKFKEELIEKYRDENVSDIAIDILKERGLNFNDWYDGDEYTKGFISGVMHAIRELKIDKLVDTREYVGDGFYQIDDDFDRVFYYSERD